MSKKCLYLPVIPATPSKVQGVCKKKGRAWHQGWHGASRPVVAGRADKNGGGKFLTRHMADGPSV